MRKFEDSLLEIVQLRGGYDILNNKQKTLDVYMNLNAGSDKVNWIREAFDCGAIPYMMKEMKRGSTNYVVIKKKIFKMLCDCRSDTVRNGKVMICMFRAVGWDDTAGEVQKSIVTGKKIVPVVTAAVVCVAVGCAFLFGKPVVKWAEGIVNDYEGRNASDNQQSDTLLAGQSMSDEKSVTQQKSEKTKQQASSQNRAGSSTSLDQPVYQDDSGMADVTTLNWVNMGLSDTSCVRGYDNLYELYLGENQITDLSDLSSLTKLGILNIYHNPASDFSPLSSITSLTRLDAGETPVSDLSPLSSLYGLKYLDIWYTNVSDLSPLSGLTSLTNLYLSHSLVTSLDPIVNLPNLSVLSISGLNITDGSLERFKKNHPNCKIYSLSYEDERGSADGYLMPQSNVYILSKTFLKKYSTYDLWIAKNEIFARRGRKFKNAELQNYFNGKNWYRGLIESDDFNPDTMLSDVEKANVDLMIELGADTYQNE